MAGEPQPPCPPDAAVARGLRQMEGYLLWQAEVTRSRRAAEAFADRLPWLTPGQREQVENLYLEERLQCSRDTIRHISRRCGEIEQQYADRYWQLRARLTAAHLLLLAALCGALLLLTALTS